MLVAERTPTVSPELDADTAEYLKARILEVFDVTQEEVDRLDRIMFGPENRARRQREQEWFESQIVEVPAELNALLEGVLPEGCELRWEPSAQ